eukprot:TRINITY_DN11028_c0_g1_i1.p1 TRINITY_DN11028_c0_g1~~TRINITY_DN11028_c0_g1_i1.p1  ORF type:complete len:1457 (+),score=340.47 TRINITY_DN11028_c0_g1_i1:79-4449(+)
MEGTKEPLAIDVDVGSGTEKEGMMEDSLTAVPVDEEKSPTGSDITVPIFTGTGKLTAGGHLRCNSNVSMASSLVSNRSSLSAMGRGRKRTHTQIFNDIVNTSTFAPVPRGMEVPPAICVLAISACVSAKLCSTAILFPAVEKLMKCDYNSEQLVLQHERYTRASRPTRIKVSEFVHTNNRSHIADMVQSILAVISSILYVYESYQVDNQTGSCSYRDFVSVNISGAEVPLYTCDVGTTSNTTSLLWVRIVESAFALIFTIDYVLRFYIAHNKLKYFFSLFPMVDLVTIIPVVLSWINDENTTSFGFIRIIRLLRLLRVLKAYRIVDGGKGQWNAIKQANVLIFTIISLLFVSSGLIQLVERDQNLTFGDAVYFMVVTMATVGYGDIRPITTLGKVVMVLLISTAIILIPVQTRSLIDLLGEQPKEIFKDMPGGERGYVIVAGHHISHDEVYMFVKEFFHPLHNSSQPPGVIIVSREPVSPKLRLLVGSKWYKRRVRFVLGSLLDDDTLRKIKAWNSKACFVLTAGEDKNTELALTPDGNTVGDSGLDIALQTHNFRSFTKYQVETYCLLKHSAGRSTTTAASADYIVSLDESRLKLMAQSCICPGLSTLVINFITSFREVSGKKRAKLRTRKVTDTDEYRRGMTHVVYEMQVPKQLVNQNFIEAAIAVYMKFEIVLLGVMNTTNEKEKSENKEVPLGSSTSWATNSARRQSTLKGLRDVLDDANLPAQAESGFNFVLNPGHRYKLQADDILAVLAIDLATCEVCQEYDGFPLQEREKEVITRKQSFYGVAHGASLHLSKRRMAQSMDISIDTRRRQDVRRRFKALVWAIVSLWKLRPVKASLVERTVLDVNAAIVKYRHYVHKRETASNGPASHMSGSPVINNLTINSSPVMTKLEPPVVPGGRDRGLSMTSLSSTMGRNRGMSMTENNAARAMMEIDMQSKIVELTAQLVAKDAALKEALENGTSPMADKLREQPDILAASARSIGTLYTDGGHVARDSVISDLKSQLVAKELLLNDLMAQMNPSYFGGFRRTDWRKEGVFKDHIIITGGQKHLGQFMRALKRSLCATKTPLKTVLYLAPNPPAQEVWNRVSHYRYFYFCQGDPKLPNDLFRAGLEEASSLVILASDVVEEVPDADAVFITMAAITLCPVDVEGTKAAAEQGDGLSKGLSDKLHKAAAKNKRGASQLRRPCGKPLFVTAELTSSASVKYFNDFDVLQATRSFGLTPPERMELRLKTDWREDVEKSDSMIDEEVEAFSSAHQSSPFYSAGYLISNHMLGPILPHSYYSPSLIRIVEQFMQGSLNQYGSFLGSVPVPDILVGSTYGELFYSMSLKSEMIPLGLYRAPGADSKSPLPYVYTNPPKNTVVKANDHVYVLQSGKDIEEGDTEMDDESYSNYSGKAEPFETASLPNDSFKQNNTPTTPSPQRLLRVPDEREVHFHPSEPFSPISSKNPLKS